VPVAWKPVDGRDKPGHDDAESGFDPICRSAAS